MDKTQLFRLARETSAADDVHAAGVLALARQLAASGQISQAQMEALIARLGLTQNPRPAPVVADASQGPAQAGGGQQ